MGKLNYFSKNAIDSLRLYTYIYPMIGGTKESYESGNKLLNKLFDGIYFYDTNKPEWGDDIIIFVYKDLISKGVKQFLEESKMTYEYYYENIRGDLYGIVAFKVPYEFQRDFECIKNDDLQNLSQVYLNKLRNIFGCTLHAKDIDYNTAQGLKRKSRLHNMSRTLNLNEIPTKEGSL